jgi:4-amino-4-deoxy-L-arabinose transferase-like glycosyltransferase
MTALSIAREPQTGVAPRLLAFLAVYFLLQILLRLLAVTGLGVDDAEMVVITQELAWGYGSQPPLYNWLQIGAFAVLGFGAPAIVILHFLLLFAAFVLVFLSGRLVFASDMKAAGVTLALFTVPQIGWEALHSHTHTLLTLVGAALTLLAMLRVFDRGRWGDYALLGVALAFGVLAKYSFLPVAVAFLVAGASLPALRGRVLSVRMLVAIALALVLLAPHLHWVINHPEETLSRTFKFRIEEEAGLLLAWGKGLVAMVGGVASYVALAVVVFAGAVYFPVRGRDPRVPVRQAVPEGRAFILRALAVALVLVLVAVLATRATEVKARWLQPILFMTPFALMVFVEPRLTVFRERLVILFSAAIGVIFLVALSVAYLLPTASGTPFRALAPFKTLAANMESLGFERGTILAEDFYIAGNLKLHLPGTMAAEPEYGLWPRVAGQPAAPVMVVWSGRRDRPPRALRTLFEELCGPGGALAATPVRMTERYQHGSRARFSLTVIKVDSCPAADLPEG